ncbi:hypothetical protein RHGRI_003915 [Rhododendron griersonianum]|uniref:Uncharacterized protein n=1 Tax=Rhododendron griersonianum TaxID=479676 RepID=A0AAV6L737_9ERIC|nr:hypothetical protein RHGRI_003915 [Rhododendron griersonianum]
MVVRVRASIISRFGHFLTDAYCASEDVFWYFKNRFRKCVEAVVMVKSLGNQELNLEADILYVDPSIDLALCKSILTLGNPDNCKNATRVRIISEIPLYLCNIFLENLESCLPYHKIAPADFRFITCDMNAGCGFSGGPTVNFDVGHERDCEEWRGSSSQVKEAQEGVCEE